MCEEVQILCGLDSHPIEGPPSFLTEERLINFVKKIRPEFRPEYEVCQTCHEITERVYKQKYKSALRKRKLKLNGSPNDGLVSDPSISSRSRLEHNSIERLALQMPRLTRIQSCEDIQISSIDLSNKTVSERNNASSTSASSVKRMALQSESVKSLTQN